MYIKTDKSMKTNYLKYSHKMSSLNKIIMYIIIDNKGKHLLTDWIKCTRYLKMFVFLAVLLEILQTSYLIPANDLLHKNYDGIMYTHTNYQSITKKKLTADY